MKKCRRHCMTLAVPAKTLPTCKYTSIIRTGLHIYCKIKFKKNLTDIDRKQLMGVPPPLWTTLVWSRPWPFDLKILPVYLCPKLHQNCKFSEITASSLWNSTFANFQNTRTTQEQKQHLLTSNSGRDINKLRRSAGLKCLLMPLQPVILTDKVGQSDLVLVCDQGTLVQVCASKITSPCVPRLPFMPPWLTCRQTHRQHYNDLILTTQPAEQKYMAD